MKFSSPLTKINCALMLALCLGPGGYIQLAKAQPAPTVNTNSAEWAAYQNDQLFDQLSGAARTRAEMKFGRKPARGPKQNPTGSGQESSSGAMALAPASFSPLPNPLVNNPTNDATSRDTQSETTLTLGAGANVVCAFNDSGQSANGMYTGFSQSTNGAVSWVDKGSLPISTNGDLGDPVLATSAKTGTILLSTLSFYSSEKILIFRSVDNGLTFSGPTNGAPGFTTTTGDQDKEWITVDNFPGTGFGNVYMFWRNFGSPGGMTLTSSTDDGLTWGPSGGTVLASGGQGAQVVVGPDHAVYCFWYDSSLSPDRISMRKSTDLGASFGPPVTVATFIGTGVNGDLGLGGFRSSSFPQIVVNPVSSNLYIVYPDVTAGADRGNIWFRQSTDGGTNWSSPAIKVNDDSTTRAQFEPALAVKPDGSGLAVCWYDRRRDPADALIERWGVTAAISGNTVTFGPNFRISPQFPAVFGVDPAINSTYMGDYDMMAADANFFYTTWGDNRDPSIAVPTRNNANIRSATFTMAGPGPVVDVDSVLLTGGNGNGFIDPNECNNLTVAVRNDGSGTATGISATLSTSTPGVSIAQSDSTYPDLAPGAAANNTTTYKISTDSSFVCGTPVNLTLTIVYGVTNANPSSFVISSPGYVVTQSAGATIFPGVGDVLNHGDDITTPLTLPFSYTFYGQSFTTARLSSNGNLQFTGANSDYVNACLPAAAFANAIFAHWDDLRTDGTNGAPQGIYTNLSGTAPNRVFDIEWRASYYSGNSNGNTVNFELRLYEGQQRFDLIYGALNGTGSSATVGVQKDTGSFTQFECNAGGLSNGLQLTFQSITCPDGGGACGGPVADFTASPTSGVAPLTVSFTSLSTGATNYSWDFGDGHTSTATNPPNTYAAAGSYTVRLTVIGPTVMGPAGTNTLTRANYIVVTNVPPVIADFAGSPTTGTTPLTVFFTNLSSGASSYSWNFGDGNSSSATNPTHTYSNAGTNTVVLIATGAGGTDTRTRANYIMVTNGPPVIVAQPMSVTAPQKTNVTFNVTAAGSPPLSYQWRDNGVNLVNGGRISGATTPTLTISNIGNRDAGQYSVLVTNTYGSALSSNATLTVTRGKGGPALALSMSALNSNGSAPGLQLGSDGNRLFILWPADPAWALETSTNLSPDGWDPVLDPPMQLGDQFAVPVQTSELQRFYRLRYSQR